MIWTAKFFSGLFIASWSNITTSNQQATPPLLPNVNHITPQPYDFAKGYTHNIIQAIYYSPSAQRPTLATSNAQAVWPNDNYGAAINYQNHPQNLMQGATHVQAMYYSPSTQRPTLATSNLHASSEAKRQLWCCYKSEPSSIFNARGYTSSAPNVWPLSPVAISS